ncbi:hypothetical protein [Ammoniphilus sp. CFH 90114]|uniref:hypothetical protein n=1 Tax=Ammoniphilus sp. CFH 90114 TaxID=2493665 RepID=UPI00100DF09B|nr:hypothetical protein [Ammoniphilus sp. CFH 90114]RXT08940.1 hypothetical protein EIZ39_09095 [Ammoniphilus sp. CFH 90114]
MSTTILILGRGAQFECFTSNFTDLSSFMKEPGEHTYVCYIQNTSVVGSSICMEEIQHRSLEYSSYDMTYVFPDDLEKPLDWISLLHNLGLRPIVITQNVKYTSIFKLFGAQHVICCKPSITHYRWLVEEITSLMSRRA